MIRYVTVELLCAASGLSRADLWELEAARLLLPTQATKAARYRVGWARKLVCLRTSFPSSLWHMDLY